MKLQKDLREFVELLNSHEVEFLVVGGHAVAFHGYPRFTGDIDFFVRPSQQNASKIGDALEAFGFPEARRFQEALMTEGKIVQLGYPPSRIDLLTSATGLEFEDASKQAIPGELDGLPVRFLDRSSLLRNKRASGRAKDLADVEELEKILRPR